MSATALALSALEIAVGRRRATLSWRQLVRIHAEAHRAAGLAPLRPGGREDLAEAFGFGLRPHPHRARHDQHPHAVGDLAAAQDVRDDTQILDPSVGTRPDENSV